MGKEIDIDMISTVTTVIKYKYKRHRETLTKDMKLDIQKSLPEHLVDICTYLPLQLPLDRLYVPTRFRYTSKSTISKATLSTGNNRGNEGNSR